MKKNIIIISILLAIIFGVFTLFKSFSNPQSSTQNDQVEHQLVVSILPQKQIVKSIAGESFAVNELIPPGFSPATYDPTAEEMKLVSEAEIYFRIGHIPFEKTHLEKLEEINPSMVIVDTSVNNTLREIEAHSHGEEEHHEEDEHDEHEHEDGIDPHVWLSPRMVQKQAKVILDSLVEEYPEYTEEFNSNYEQLVGDLDDLDKELTAAFAPIKGKSMLVYHPAYGYLARDYGFVQEHIEIEGKEPSVDDIQSIINEAKEEGVQVIFVQAQFSQDSAKAIAEGINGAVVEVDPLALNYLNNMSTMAKTITNSLK
jgi:zinc transport system substrate-binding protein